MLTTILEVAGAAAVVAGTFLLAGLGWALIVAGAGAIAFSFLMTRPSV